MLGSWFKDPNTDIIGEIFAGIYFSLYLSPDINHAIPYN